MYKNYKGCFLVLSMSAFINVVQKLTELLLKPIPHFPIVV